MNGESCNIWIASSSLEMYLSLTTYIIYDHTITVNAIIAAACMHHANPTWWRLCMHGMLVSSCWAGVFLSDRNLARGEILYSEVSPVWAVSSLRPTRFEIRILLLYEDCRVKATTLPRPRPASWVGLTSEISHVLLALLLQKEKKMNDSME